MPALALAALVMTAFGPAGAATTQTTQAVPAAVPDKPPAVGRKPRKAKAHATAKKAAVKATPAKTTAAKPTPLTAHTVSVQPAPRPTAPVGTFSFGSVVAMAKSLAAKPYVPPDTSLPPPFDKLSYDQYRDIRFRPDKAIWAGTGLPFQLQLFHRGAIYKARVEISIVKDGIATPLAYSPDDFSFGPLVPKAVPPKDGAKPAAADIGFAGFRIHTVMANPNYFDELAVFLGASYFRSLAPGEVYGLSARGLAVKTGEPSGEEFPRFTAFWIVQPKPDDTSITVYALLDSPSVSGAYSFVIQKGLDTEMRVSAVLFPRVSIDKIGIAPMSSMFYFAANDRVGIDDFRPAVHDSDGLEMHSGAGEWIWRPLADPAQLQVSAFVDQSPKGFGLVQRARSFADYQDLEAHYERRPSLWVEPEGDWGGGHVILIEIPTSSEVNDNIVAFWRPDNALVAHRQYDFHYKLFWGDAPPVRTSMAQVVSTAIGKPEYGAASATQRLAVIDFGPGELPSANSGAARLTGHVSVSAGTVSDVTVEANPHTHGTRLSFRFDPGKAGLVELRASLEDAGNPASETWLYRWTSE